ncbi:unnamed protein product [Bubo scandiacus]
MSRFFTTGSDSESESSVSGDELVTKPVGATTASEPILLSEDEEDTKRVVRSAKDKRFEELTNLIKTIRNAMKIRDGTKCLEEFELLGRATPRPSAWWTRRGVPRFYVRILADLEDYLNELWEDKEGKKKMNKNNAKALSSLRQKLRKHNRDFERELSGYRQNPELSDEDEEKKSSSSSSSPSSDEDDAGAFLKKKEPGGRRPRALPEEAGGGGGGVGVGLGGRLGGVGLGVGLGVGRGRGEVHVAGLQIPQNVVVKKLNETPAGAGQEGDGPGGADRAAAAAGGNRQRERAGGGAGGEDQVQHHRVALRLQPQPGHPHEARAVAEVSRLHRGAPGRAVPAPRDLHRGKHPGGVGEPEQPRAAPAGPRVHPDAGGADGRGVHQDHAEHGPPLPGVRGPPEGRGPGLRHHRRLQRYLQEKGTTEELCRVYLRRVLHTYYKFDYRAHRRGAGDPQGAAEEEEEEEEEEDSAALMERLCKYVYAKDRTDRIRTCAILCHIYHHALHSRWYQARDLMLMSHLQDNIQHADPPCRLGGILYNRTMVQLGICAFRQGLIKDAHNALLDIQSSGRAKELLGQGLLLRSLQERNAEQEKVEKRRQVPFHMHVNLELLECVYLVAAMLLEIPYMAAHEFDARRRMISKQFHHQLRVGERQPLLGEGGGGGWGLRWPPESMREHVVAASKAMKTGDWRTCHRFVVNDKMNGKVWDLFPEADKVRAMLVRKIQEESLLHVPLHLQQRLRLHQHGDPGGHELMASLDQPTQTVMMHRTEPTAQQNLALQLAEKLGNLVENNERVFDHKQGSYGGYFRGPTPPPRAPHPAPHPPPPPLTLFFFYPPDQKDGYRKGDGGYLRRGGYRQQDRGSNY